MHLKKLHLTKFVLAVLLIVPGYAAPAAAEKRVALVIGNGAYQHADGLANPVTDARSMRTALTKIGFDDAGIVYGENLAKRDFERAIARFAAAVGDSDVALVFYAGHGSTFDGIPYAVPIDAQFTNLDGMRFELVTLDAMVGELRRTRGVGIAIFDACRDNAVEQQLKRTQPSRGGGASRGLAPAGNTDGLIVSFSTGYGATAADGPTGSNSPYTTALLQELQTPGLDVVDLFRNVGRRVKEQTAGRQNPALQIDGFYNRYALNAGAIATPPRVTPLPATDVPIIDTMPPVITSSRVRPAGFIFPDSDQRLLTAGDLSSLSPEDLRVARNEIFARHGIYFRSPELQAHFRKFAWYHPNTWNPTLNNIEEQNVARLQQQEQTYGAVSLPGGKSTPLSGGIAADREFIFPDSDRRLLTRNDLAGLSAADLRIARNEIFARRGRFFDSPELQQHFGRFSWYRPYTKDPPLNAIESQNVKLLQQAEAGR
jgi:hypothetical protein